MNQPFDVSTIIFAALAIFIVWKLRSVLGARTGDERPPANPFVRRDRSSPDGTAPANQAGSNVIPLPGAAPAAAASAMPDPNRWKGVAAPNGPAIAGLDAIAAADSSFAGRSFMEGARSAYEMIVAAFARGDKTALAGLLSKDVLDGFTAAIVERDAKRETIEHTFVALDEALVEEAQLRAKTAQIGIRFTSQQINAVRRADGTLAEDGSDTVGHVVDHWTFARDTTARDPNWKLVATNAE